MKSEVLLGDEAVGLGAMHAGLSGVYAYPGTPSTEIFEFVEQRTQRDGTRSTPSGAPTRRWPTRRRSA